MEEADDERLVPPPAAPNATTAAMPLSTALSLTASSSQSRSSGYTSNGVVGIASDFFLSSSPTAVNVAAPAHHALEQEMLYRVDLQGAVPASSGRRERRMIKNREAAARSRARKQAYTHELEKEVRLLQAENDTLRERCEELEAAVDVQVPVKKALQRVSSAPF